MSSTTLYGVTSSGKLREIGEFRNSHRGAFMVWLYMFRKFCDKKDDLLYESVSYPCGDDDYKKVWALFRDGSVPRPYRIVLGSTFDHVILETHKVEEFIVAVRIYAEDFPVGHLLQQCAVLEKYKKSKRYVGFAWNQTSVGETWPGAYKRGFSAFDTGWYLFRECQKYDGEVSK